MSDKTTFPLEQALTAGLSEVTRQRTVMLYEQHRASGSDRSFNFRGDIAERFHYDKIKPTLAPAQVAGYVVAIEGVSQKTGETHLYQILGNQWNLIEVLARLD